MSFVIAIFKEEETLRLLQIWMVTKRFIEKWFQLLLKIDVLGTWYYSFILQYWPCDTSKKDKELHIWYKMNLFLLILDIYQDVVSLWFSNHTLFNYLSYSKDILHTFSLKFHFVSSYILCHLSTTKGGNSKDISSKSLRHFRGIHKLNSNISFQIITMYRNSSNTIALCNLLLVLIFPTVCFQDISKWLS